LTSHPVLPMFPNGMKSEDIQDKCDLCGGRRFRIVRPIGDRHIIRCRGCGLTHQSPRPSLGEATHFYRHDYFASDNAVAHGYEDYAALARPTRRLARRKLLRMRRCLEPGKLLDVGAAYGLFLDEARKAGWNAEGVEISAAAARVARRLTGLPVAEGPLERARFAPESFDAITLWDVLEHATEVRSFLGRVRELLRPGGWLFITVPNVASRLAQLMGAQWFGYAKVEHVYYFSPVTLRRAVELAGLRFQGWTPWPWACTVDYVARRLAIYNRTAARVARALARAAGLADAEFFFHWIDILAVATRPADG